MVRPASGARSMRPEAFRSTVRLEGRYIDLVPLAAAHLDALVAAGRDPRVWEFMRYGARDRRESMAELIDLLLERQRLGQDLPFTVRRHPGEVPIGMTRYLDIDRPNRSVEIGGTWYDPAYWRTPINTEAKYLLLRHAFEVENVLRVQLKTDTRNARSQRAIERLGAVREGVLREHLILPDGVVRSSVIYSIVEREWPSVRQRLESLLDRPWIGGRARPSEAA